MSFCDTKRSATATTAVNFNFQPGTAYQNVTSQILQERFTRKRNCKYCDRKENQRTDLCQFL